MSPPPKFLITRKLIRHFFINYLPRQPQGITLDHSPLFECWEKWGIDHPNCKEAENKVDQDEETIRNYQQKVQDMKIRNEVMSTLRRPVYRFERKGRHQEKWTQRQWSLYDGIKY